MLYEEEVSHDPDFESGAISTLRFPLIARFHWIVPIGVGVGVGVRALIFQ